MAKVRKARAKKPPKKPIGPDHLTMRLFAPGMTALHRAGLGGLACTLKYIERSYRQGALCDDDVPGGSWGDNAAPWSIEADQVTLRFGEPTAAGEYLKRLFAIAFQIKDGLIYLPGQYGEVPPPLAVRSELQNGLLLTLYDHGPQSRRVREVIEETIEVDDKPIAYRAAHLDWYKHQRDGEGLALKSLSGDVAVSRMLFPGAIVRHDSFKESAVAMGAELLVPLLFAPVGIFGLRMSGKTVTVRGRRMLKSGGVLVIPNYADLSDVHNILPILLPQEFKMTRVGSIGDAVLAAEVRLHAAGLLSIDAISSIRSVWCCPTSWNSQLQPPSQVYEITRDALGDVLLERYACALSYLPPRVRTRLVEEKNGQRKARKVKRREESFLADSVVRPRIADNLARGRKWYAGFTRFMTAINPATDRPYRNQLSFEREGLIAMVTDDRVWDDDGESLVVRAVHEAISYRLGQIRNETDGDRPLSQATKNRWDRFRQRLRLDLSGAKTQGQLRFALCDLFSRAGQLPSLKDGWQTLLPMFSEHKWQQTRDLALLACASYSGKGAGADDETPVTA